MGEVVDTFWEGAADIWNPIVGDNIKELHISETLDKGPERRRRARQAQQEAESRARRARGPNLDEAQRSQVESDRLRRRRGVLANIYGGSSASRPSVAVKTLLGQ